MPPSPSIGEACASLVGTRAARAGDVVRRESLRAGVVFAPRLRVRRLIARIDRP